MSRCERQEPFSSGKEVAAFLHHLFPSFFSFGVSFATIVMLWIDHHFLFHLIKKGDIRFVLLNFVFILVLSPLPFTTALAGRNYESSFAVSIVAANYFLMALSFAFFMGIRNFKEAHTRRKIKGKVL